MIIKPIRKTAEEHKDYIGPEGSISVITDRHEVRVHDGKTPGGFPSAGDVVRPGDKIPLKDLEDLPGQVSAANVPSTFSALQSTPEFQPGERPIYCFYNNNVAEGWQGEGMSAMVLVDDGTSSYWETPDTSGYGYMKNTLGAAHPIHQDGKLPYLLLNVSAHENHEYYRYGWSGDIEVYGPGGVLLGKKFVFVDSRIDVVELTDTPCWTVLVPLQWPDGVETIEGISFVPPPETWQAYLRVHRIALSNGVVDGWIDKVIFTEEEAFLGNWSIARSTVDGTILVATSLRLYRTTDNGHTWEDISSLLPPVENAGLGMVYWLEGSNEFVILRGNQIYVSSDSNVWTAYTPLPEVVQWDSIFYVPSKGRYYLTGKTSTHWTVYDTADLATIDPPADPYSRQIDWWNRFFWIEETGWFFKVTFSNNGETSHIWVSPDAETWTELTNSEQLAVPDFDILPIMWLPHLNKLAIGNASGEVFVNKVEGAYDEWERLPGVIFDYDLPVWSDSLGKYIRPWTLEVSDDLVNWEWKYGSTRYWLHGAIPVPESNVFVAITTMGYDIVSVAIRPFYYELDGTPPGGNIQLNWEVPGDTVNPTDYFIRGDKTWAKVTKQNVGLGDVENYPVASQEEAEAGVANDRYMTPLRTTQLLDVRFEDVLQTLIDSFNSAADQLNGASSDNPVP